MRTHENCYYHDTTQFFTVVKECIFTKVAPLYAEGWSLSDIQAHTGYNKKTIRKVLFNNGVTLRSNRTTSHFAAKKAKGKISAKPPFGFCYFQGKVVPDPKECTTLLFIHKLWAKGEKANTIFKKLNDRHLPTRMGKAWSWKTVQNILRRFEKKQIVVTGGRHCELR